MLSKNYPEHDINKVFDMFEEVINKGGVSEKTGAELTLINKLFAAMPPEASEYAMMMLHGTPASTLPGSTKEIMPLYVRFMNLADYLTKVESLREVPASLTKNEIMERHKMMDSLGEHEKAFGEPLLGYGINTEVQAAPAKSSDGNNEEEGGSGLHLMNQAAIVFGCVDPVKTALCDRAGQKSREDGAALDVRSYNLCHGAAAFVPRGQGERRQDNRRASRRKRVGESEDQPPVCHRG